MIKVHGPHELFRNNDILKALIMMNKSSSSLTYMSFHGNDYDR